MSEQDLNPQVGEEVKVVTDENAGPMIDPSGTFVGWKRLRDIGFVSTEEGEKEEDFIPLPITDDEGYKILQPNPQVTIERPMYSITPSRKGMLPLYNFGGPESEMYSALVQYDIFSQRKKRKYVDEHAEALDLSRSEMVGDSYLWKTQWREGARWTNNPVLGGVEMAMSPANTGTVLNQIQIGNDKHTTGVNNVFTLWHSGFSVRIKTPTGREIAEMDALIASERNVFGRRTGGSIFSANRCYLESGLTDLFISHLEHTNVENWTPEIIRSLIDNRDIQIIALGLQAAKYPNNYPAVEPCTESDVDCRNVRTVSFTPMNALIVDDAYFNAYEISFLSARNTKRSVQEVLDFQKRATWNNTKTVRVTSNTEIRLKHPKAVDVQNAGFVWAGGISASINRVLGDDSPTRNRVNMMSNLVDRESLRAYLPYVDAVIVDGVEKDIEEEELLDTFSHFSDDMEIVRKFELDIRDYEERDVVAYMGTPRHVCGECEKRLAVKDPERLAAYRAHPIIVPQDAVVRFFTSRRL